MANYSNNVNSNNVTNNFTIIPLGRENVSELLTLIEKKEILKSKFSCLESVVDLIHCGKYDQYKNIIITNLKDDYAYKYDDDTKTFICVDKNEIISELVDERIGDIKNIYAIKL